VTPALISFARWEVANASVTRACRALIAVLSFTRAVISSMWSASVPGGVERGQRRGQRDGPLGARNVFEPTRSLLH